MKYKLTSMKRPTRSPFALLFALATACGGSDDVPEQGIDGPLPRPGGEEDPADSSSGGDEPTTPTDPGDDEGPGLDRAPAPPGGGSEPTDPPDSDAPVGDLQLCVKLAAAPCPTEDDAGMVHHGGLRPWASCRFELADKGTWEMQDMRLDVLADTLTEVGVEGVLADTDRLATSVGQISALSKLQHFAHAFRWQDVDFGDAAWMPQGISGSFDANSEGLIDGRKVVATAWYYKASVGGLNDRDSIVRVSFADISALEDDGAVPYRHVLLVEPYDSGGVVNFKATKLHAGGIAWVGRYLYVADTANGLRVYDTSRIMEVSTAKDGIGFDAQSGDYLAYGYKYVLPMVSHYALSDQSCWVRTSFVSLDATSDPPSLVTGEWHDNDIAGKLVRWPLDGERLLESDPERGAVMASEVYFAQESDVQGGISIDGDWFLSTSAQSGNQGLLYRVRAGRESAAYGWVVGPEDLMWDRQAGHRWSLNECAGQRYVFSVAASQYAKL